MGDHAGDQRIKTGKRALADAVSLGSFWIIEQNARRNTQASQKITDLEDGRLAPHLFVRFSL
jgi:hypothetical protein